MKTPSFEEILKTDKVVEKKEFKLKQIMARNNNCKIFIGGSENDLIDYPYRLAPCDRANERIRNASTELMIDSTINDPDVSNESVLEKAIELSAQWVFPKDYWGDIDETHESLVEFEKMAAESEFAGNIIYPLQPPHDRHYLKYEDFYREKSFLAIGGLKEAKPRVQIEAAKDLQKVIDDSKWVHGLGMGCSRYVIDQIHENPQLLDSIDTSTFEQVPKNAKVTDSDWIQHDIKSPRGENVSALNALQGEQMVYEANYQLTSFYRDALEEEEEEEEEAEETEEEAENEEEETQTSIRDNWGQTENSTTAGNAETPGTNKA